MRIFGRRHPPILFFIILSFIPTLLLCGEIPFFTIPLKTARQVQPNYAAIIYPNHQWIPLAERWDVYSLNGDTLGSLHIPFSFRGKQPLHFRKTFDLKNLELRSNYFLHLLSINGKAQVKINGFLLYQGHLNFLPITLFIPSRILKVKNNILDIEIFPNWGVHTEFPHWFPINLPRIDSGILNGVYLEKTPPTYFRDPQIDFHRKTSQLEISIIPRINLKIKNTKNWRITFKTTDLSLFPLQTASLSPDSLNKGFHFSFLEKELWSTDNPRLFHFSLTLDSAGQVIDRMVYPLSLKMFLWTGNGFLLNDRSTKIKGINYIYQDVEGTSLFNQNLAKADLQQIKKRGYNAIRTVLNLLPESFYEICDAQGILCFQDLPIILTPGISDLDSLTFVQIKKYFHYINQLAERHPSLAAIGISIFFDPYNTEAISQLKILLDKLPGSRLPIYINSLGMNNLELGSGNFQIVEILNRKSEIGLEHQIKQLEKYPGQLPSSFSKAISYRVDSTTIAHDVLQIKNLTTVVEKSFKNNRLPGFFLNTFSDFYTQFPSIQNGISGNFSLNSYGLFTLNRHPKKVWATDISGASSFNKKLIITEARGRHSYYYILLGMLNLFILLFMYQKFKEFRHNLNYSIKKPHGFFVNLQERIYIPIGQSLFLLLIISINGAISLSAISYYFRNNLLFDYILSLLFFNPKIKLWMVYLIWKQPLILLVATFVNFLVIYFLAIPLKIFSWFGEIRVPFTQAVAASIWAASPFVFLVPISIFLYNLLISIKSYWILLAILLYFHVWFYFRWINAVRVLTGRLYWRVFLLFSGVLIVLLGGLLLFYNRQINLFEQVKLIYHIYRFIA